MYSTAQLSDGKYSVDVTVEVIVLVCVETLVAVLDADDVSVLVSDVLGVTYRHSDSSPLSCA